MLATLSVLLAANTAMAGILDLSTTYRGRYTHADAHQPGNYQCSWATNAEYRPYFAFNIPALENVTILSAHLILQNHDITGAISTVEATQVQFTSTALSGSVLASGTAHYGNLGVGTVFGLKTYMNTDHTVSQPVELNTPAALEAILAALGGEFVISARILNRDRTRMVYGSSSAPSSVRLVINYEDNPPPPPEPPLIPLPSTAALAAAGLFVVAGRRRR
jgi:MYXO-CTERM domain-containing protein